MDTKCIVEMEDSYPFGKHQAACQDIQAVTVLKKLTFRDTKELAIIKTMVNLVQNLEDQHLIQLKNSQIQGEDQIFLYYEYVPLTVQRWILDVGEEIADQLEFQMLSLANYLTTKNIKFSFNPKCLGLDKDMKVKYFLQEFMMEPDNKMHNFKIIEKEIKHFFWELRQNKQENEETSTQFSQRLSVDTVMLPNRSIVKNDRSSWEVGLKTAVTVQKIKKKILSEKIQKSKQKSLQVLKKLKAIRMKTQES